MVNTTVPLADLTKLFFPTIRGIPSVLNIDLIDYQHTIEKKKKCNDSNAISYYCLTYTSLYHQRNLWWTSA
jgi:hypothetical protein